MDKALKIWCSTLLELHKRAFKAQLRGQFEVCGVVLLDSQNFMNLEYLTNRTNSPGTHSMEVCDINKIALKGNEILGSFHSHPISEARPGDKDIQMGFYKKTEFIYDVCGREGRLWHLDGGHLIELDFEIYKE